MSKGNTKPRLRNDQSKLPKDEFMKRFHKIFCDPHFDPFRSDLEKISQVAFENYQEGRKAPSTRKAGPAYKDPEYELSEDWLYAKEEITRAQTEHENQAAKDKVLLIIASDRNEMTCPGEYSKTSRLAEIARHALEARSVEVDLLDLSLMTSEYGKTIYACKACVSTAMPLCHWPCSCYPNHSLGQTHDWMNEIYPRWVRAHGIMIITPVYWYQAPSALKLMMDRLVCADGGNPDPTTTQGKKAELAKKLELDDWDYPRHLADRVFSVIVHGDAVGTEGLKNNLEGWLTDMKLIPAAPMSQLARYIGYYESYALSHEALDKDRAFMEEVHNSALGLAAAIRLSREGGLNSYQIPVNEPRAK